MNSAVLLGTNAIQIEELNEKIMRMTHLSKHREIDDEGYILHLQPNASYSAVVDLQDDYDPYFYHHNNKTYIICFYGELYNSKSLIDELILAGYTLKNHSDIEVVLLSFIEWKEECLHKLNGVFSFVIDDGHKLFLARDPLGVKPLFYFEDRHVLVVSNQIKSILAYQNEAVVDKEGIKELLGLGPSMTPGKTIYKNIYSLRPAHYMYYSEHMDMTRYCFLKDQIHEDTFKDTVNTIKSLVEESTVSMLDEDICLMLSGGLDSTILTAIASSKNKNIDTFSVSYSGQKDYFTPYDYQTSMDDEYIEDAIELYGCTHQEITLSEIDLVNGLKEALVKRDYPGMADIDVSLMLFTKEIANKHTICLSGECADELFGGYPWFYKKELYNLPHFPWMKELDYRLSLLNKDMEDLHIKDYIIERYNQTLSEMTTHNKSKQIMYLNLEWFMQTLLTRCETMSTHNLKVRVPFASYKLAEYLYNIPFDFIMYNNEEKGLLREAFKDVLPQSILHRKKNPYPKTHSPIYKTLISHLLLESLKDTDNILLKLFDIDKLNTLILTQGDAMKYPWYGQLMMGPQFMAYLYSIYLWGKIYHIKLEL